MKPKTYKLTTYLHNGIDTIVNFVYIITEYQKQKLRIATHSKRSTRFDVVNSSLEEFIQKFEGIATKLEKI